MHANGQPYRPGILSGMAPFVACINNSFRSFQIIFTVKYKFDGNLLINVTLPILKFGKSVAYKPERLYFCKTCKILVYLFI